MDPGGVFGNRVISRMGYGLDILIHRDAVAHRGVIGTKRCHLLVSRLPIVIRPLSRYCILGLK